MFDFKTAPSRAGSNAEKYTLRKELFGTEDVLPAWVADMDLPTPLCVIEAVKKRLQHPIIGYEEVPLSAYEAQAKWMQKRHGVAFEVENFFYSHSVVASMHVFIEAFSQRGDEVIVQTPIYPPFFHSVSELGRKLLKNPLHFDVEKLRYSFDIEALKSKITPKTKLLLLCSPHNPVGRAWHKEELEAIVDVCTQHDIMIFSDEVHADLVYEGHTHIPLMSIPDARRRTVTAMGPGKTFNMAGFAMSSVYVPQELRERFERAYKRVHFAQGSVLSHVAFEAAYKEGEAWLESLLVHLKGNYQLLEELCAKYPHYIRLTPIEATYLAWLDCKGMGFGERKLREWFIKEAKLGLNPGLSFSKEGRGFMRLNFAVSRATMTEIIKRLENALQRMKKDED